jgi:peroxiredoxin Q/BCP
VKEQLIKRLGEAMSRLEVGQKAPGFSLKDQRGEIVSLKDFSGERVVVYFYPADDTPGCTKEACQFNDGLSEFRNLKVTVLGVSPDDATSHVAFRKKYGLHFDLLSDPEKTVMTKYGAYGEKMMYGKKVVGVIRSTFVIGPSGKIEHAFYGVRADGHAEKVLSKLTN